MEPKFPVFDIYSMPLLLLLLQGFLFVLLIGHRFFKKGSLPDLLLSLFLLFFCYERIHYAIGFMGWYDSHQNTKINYFLFPMTLVYGPLLYFYVRSVTKASFRFKSNYMLHFLPFLIYFIYRIFIFSYDARQGGFADTQNGIMMSNIEIAIVNPLMILFSSFHLLLYLAFTIQLYWIYRIQIKQFYSNTYMLELNWIRNFLFIFAFLFLYDVFQSIVDGFIYELHWTQKWWFHALSSAVIIYFGVKGYFTKTHKLQDLDFKVMPYDVKDLVATETKDFSIAMQSISAFMEIEKPYLDPSLNLKDLAGLLKLSAAELSEIINAGFKVNFNDFINRYRVEEVKRALNENKHEVLSLVGIAYDSGFNSKATFNRVFKKLTGSSPTEFISNQQK